MQVTVPSDLGNPIQIIVNGVSYSLGAGETVTVPDEVAAEITRMLSAREKPAPAVEPPFEIPGDDSGGDEGGGPLVVILESGSDEQGNETLTTDKTAGEIFGAAPNVLFVQPNDAGGGAIWQFDDWKIDSLLGEQTLLVDLSAGGGIVFSQLHALSSNSVMSGTIESN